MAPHTIIIDLAALVLAVIGFHMAFRQRVVRRLWRSFVPRDPARGPSRIGQDDDPAHYALIISGMMLLAFALIFASFTTALDILTP